MKSLLEQLPSIVAEGKREAERVMERAESNYRLGLQTRELVIPSRDSNYDDLFRIKAKDQNKGAINRLIYGENFLAVAALLSDNAANKSIREGVDLVYIDPPFDSKMDYQTKINILGGDFHQKPTAIEQFAYSDTWHEGTKSYLESLTPLLYLLKECLSPQGSIYIHLGKTVSNYVKVVADSIFGADNFHNEITWKRSHAHGDTGQGARHFGRVTESIFLYSALLQTLTRFPRLGSCTVKVSCDERFQRTAFYRRGHPMGGALVLSIRHQLP